MVTRDEATNYPSVRVLRNKSSEEIVAAWKDMYGELQIRSVRTDNGSEFDGHFHEHMLVSRIRHERSPPNRPQTNARAERFHRTLAEGMRSLMLMSGVPYVFWHFVLQLLYSCMPVLLQQVVSPHLLNCVSVGFTELSRCILLVLHIISLRSSNLISLSHGAGLELCLVMGACIPMLFLILNITRIANRKFALSTLVMFGFCPNHASHFMSFRCFLLMPLCGLHGWSVMMWTLCLQQPVMIVGANCASCGAGPITRKPCLSRGRQRHDFTPGCVRGRCHGHVSLDFFVSSSTVVEWGRWWFA